MLICEKCNKEFPIWITINGIKKNLNNRKYCLECSPWGKHNTRKIIINNETNSKIKICKQCNQSKSVECFYKRRNNYNSICCDCENANTLTRQHTQKQKCIDYKGGKCVICGYNKLIAVLQFHHIRPENKLFTIGNYHLHKFDEKIINELNKCILLCANCHLEVHQGLHKEIINQYENSLKMVRIE